MYIKKMIICVNNVQARSTALLPVVLFICAKYIIVVLPLYLKLLYILATALGRVASCYVQMKKFEEAERLFRKKIDWKLAHGAEIARISAGMRSACLFYFDFLIIKATYINLLYA